MEKLLLAEQTVCHCPLHHKFQSKKLEWTGAHVELVELLYALHEVKCINGGKTTLKEIFDTLCAVFDVDMRGFSRSFTNIKNRMKGDRTVFLDKLKKVLVAKLEEADRKPSRK